MESGVLLHVAELLEPALAVRTLVRLLAGVHAYVLHQLVIGAERLEALLALVRLAHLQAAAAQRAAADAAGPAEVARLHLHGRGLLHENLRHKRNAVSTRRLLLLRRGGGVAAAWPSAPRSSRGGRRLRTAGAREPGSGPVHG